MVVRLKTYEWCDVKDDSRGERAWSSWLVLTGLAAAYFAAAKLGLSLAFVHASATAVWPPTGIAIAASLLLGYRVWPAIFGGAFLANITTQGSVATSVGIALGNTLEGVIAAYLVNEYARGANAFDRWPNVLRFVLFAGVVGPTVSATCGVTSLALGGYAEWTAYGSIAFTWWLGDAAGALVVAPLLVLARRTYLHWNRVRASEVVFHLVVLALVGQVVFGGWFPGDVKNYELSYLCLPILVWTAFRFGPRETAAANALVAFLAVVGTLRGYGPFVREGSPNESLLLLQAFMAAVAVFDLSLAAVLSQRRHVESKRERLLTELQHAVANVPPAQGLLPICASCKKIRGDEGVWEHLEEYAEARWEVRFTHGLCPQCVGDLFP